MIFSGRYRCLYVCVCIYIRYVLLGILKRMKKMKEVLEEGEGWREGRKENLVGLS